MKKYLIIGAIALTAGLYLTSCTHDDIDSRSIVEQKTQNYDAAFKKLYGDIAPGHTWGFDIPDFEDSGIIPAASRVAASRVAGSRGFTRDGESDGDGNPNHKLWAGNYVSVPTPLTDAQKNLVRNYFQQNKNPKGISITYTNFFVQQVYKGHTNLDNANNDCTEQYTAGNGDPIYGSSQMDKLTSGYKENHVNNFNNADYSGGKYDEVWTGEIRNNDPNDKVYQLDQIMLMENSSTDCFGFYNSEESGQYNDHYVIISGDAIMEWAKTQGANLSSAAAGANVAGMFFVGFDFESNKRAYNADGSLNVNTNQYLVTFCDQNTPNAVQIPNSTRWATIGGADGYFSDWIVRITEGKKKTNDGDNNNNEGGPTTTTYKKTLAKRHVLIDKGRIFCEDLSSVKDVKEDIDFNDVVFDAIIWYDYWVIVEKDNNGNITSITEAETDETHQNSLWADISLLATGATEQVKVGDYEAHAKFGTENVKYMINTVGASTSVNGVYNKDPQTPIHFTISLDDLVPSDYNGSLEDYLRHNITLDYIPITVYWNTNGAGRAAAVLAAGNVTTDENGNVIGMTAPHKIKVPLGTPWPAERRNIQEGYPDFPDYVSTMEEPWDNKESFYLYEYNWNLLAHRDMDRTNNYFFYDSQEEILDEIFLHGWYNSEDYQYPVDLGDNFNKNVVIKPENLFYNAGLAAGDVIRLYCTKKNSGGDFSLKVFGGHWESTVPIAGWSQDYWNGNTAGTMISEAAKTVFNNNGYIEIPMTNENVSAFTRVSGDGSAIILQGKNLTLTGISIKKP